MYDLLLNRFEFCTIFESVEEWPKQFTGLFDQTSKDRYSLEEYS